MEGWFLVLGGGFVEIFVVIEMSVMEIAGGRGLIDWEGKEVHIQQRN